LQIERQTGGDNVAQSKESIVEAAIMILNRDGVEGLSMRTLAKELNIKAAALYWHFEGKQELYGAIAEHMCRQMDVPADDVLAHYKAYRSMLLTVRDSPEIFEKSHPNTPRRVEIIKQFSATLVERGVPLEDLMTISNMLNNYVLSFTADEQRFKNITPAVMESLAKALDPEDRLTFISERDYDEQFELGLQVLLSGLQVVYAAS
jgi:AcrR family transcriptional regulator